MTSVANPILPGCHPDPSICRVGDWYYLVTSTFEYLPGLPVLRSRDLARWETVGHAIDRPGMLDFDGIRSSGGLYAPTIRHHDGLFWIVCTLVRREHDAPSHSPSGNFLLTASDPAGPWSDPVWLDVDGIDPSIAFDDDGRVWLHGTRLVPEAEAEWFHQTQVWVREYSRSERALVGDEHIVWTGAVRGAVWAEGPHLYRIDGRWYLLAAEGGTEYHHAVSVARADVVTGPYEGDRANPVLTHRHLGRGVDVLGPGHADLVQAQDGSWWAALLAMRAADGHHYPLGRETFLCPVSWEDGWPVFAPGEGRLPHVVDLPLATPAAAATWQPDDRAAGVIPPGDPRWTSMRVLPAEVAQAAGDRLILPVRAATLAEPAAVAFVGVRQQHADLDVEAILDLTGLAEGESAGFAVRQSEDDHATVTVTRRGAGFAASATHRRGGTEVALGDALTPAGPTLRLGVRVRGYACELRCGDETLGVVDLRQLSSIATGGFLGLWVGVFATSHGAAPRGHAVVDAFTYAPA